MKKKYINVLLQDFHQQQMDIKASDPLKATNKSLTQD
jgi:hypothetical protein